MRYTYTMTCPTGKRRFATLAVADTALDNIWKMRMRGTNRSPVSPCRSYWCDKCDGWHHTSQARRVPDVES